MIICLSFVNGRERKINVWLIGDSTCANKEIRAYPETGWGMPFTWFFDSTVSVRNKAVNGRSTKSFIAENKWQQVLDSLQPGDYVFIQFGHNDEGKEKTGRYTTPDEFAANLNRYILESRSKNAYPVLLTPVARRTFDSITGQLKESHPIYADRVRQVASDNKVPLIDLDAKSMAVIAKLGVTGSTMLFNHLQPGEHPNYPDGKTDNTHFNELGARLMAEQVLAGIRTLKLPLQERIVNHQKQ